MKYPGKTIKQYFADALLIACTSAEARGHYGRADRLSRYAKRAASDATANPLVPLNIEGWEPWEVEESTKWAASCMYPRGTTPAKLRIRLGVAS